MRDVFRPWSMAIVLLGIVSAAGPLAAAEAKPPSLDELFQRLGFTEEQRQAVEGGQIVTVDESRSRDDQLIAAVALPIAAPLSALAAPLKDGSNIGFDASTLAWGKAGSGSTQALADLAFGDGEEEELEALLRVSGGGRFNLSGEEVAFLQGKLSGLDANAPASAEAAMAAYREVLAGRAKAYAEGGLDAVADYERDGERFSPSKELRAVEAQAKDFLTTFFPGFWAALSRFPKETSPEVSSEIYWAKRTVEGRPAVVLIHQMVQAGEGFVLTSQRQFFVGHTYESLQMFGLVLPAETGGGSMIFSVNSVFTDQITGFFSGVAQSVGQERTRESMAEHFERVRKSLQ